MRLTHARQGPTNGYEGTWSSNYPLRGGKNTLFEGGTRATAIARGAGVGASLRGTSTSALIHCADWLPTLLHLAKGDVGAWRRGLRPREPPWQLGDGMDVLHTLATGEAVRDEVLLEAHPQHRGPWELPAGYQTPPRGNGVWYAPRDETLVEEQVGVGVAGGPPPPPDPGPGPDVHGNGLVTADGWKLIRLALVPVQEAGWVPPPGQDASATNYTVGCDLSLQPTPTSRPCMGPGWCLFNLNDDPCEYSDVAASHPDVVSRLGKRIATFQAGAVPIAEPEGCDPIAVDGAWRPCDAPDPGGRVEKEHSTPDASGRAIGPQRRP